MDKTSLEIAVVVEAPKPPITEERARQYFRESIDGTERFDKERRLDAAYYHNDQIPDEVKAKWKVRGQPLVWTNKIQPAISGVLGVYDAAQTDPKCEPRSPEHQDTADIATKILRYLSDCARLATIKKTLSKDYFIYGTCAVIVGEEAFSGCEHIKVRAIRWQDFFYDPASREHNFSDANYLGIARWLEAAEVSALYPERYEELGKPYDGSLSTWPGEKEADDTIWLDAQRKRVRVVELYFRDDNYEWQRVVFCQAGFLDFGPSVYTDDKGKTICPIVAMSFEVNPETKERYGPITAMRPLQNEYNSRRAVLLNEAQNRRTRQTIEGIDPKWAKIAKQEAGKADGQLPYGWDMISMPDIAAGQAQLLAKTEADLDRLAPSSTVLSAMRGGDSGRAKQILQNAGLTEWARAFGHLEELEEEMHRHLWFAAKQFMTQAQWIRYTGEARAAEWIQVNVPVGARQELVMDPQTGAPVMDEQGQPQLRTVPVLEKAIAQMDVDIILNAVPDTITLQQEANEQILKYAEGMQLPIDDPRFRMVMEMFLTVDKTRQLERWDTATSKLQEQNAGAMQMQMQMQQMQQQLEAMRVEMEAQKDAAQARKADAQAQETELRTAMMMQQMFGVQPQMPQQQPMMPEQMPPQMMPQQMPPSPQAF